MNIPAYAKINWFLEITGKRPDGYHQLETVFQTISLADEVCFHQSPKFELTCSVPELPVDASNLVYKAAQRFYDTIAPTPPYKIHLIKRVPMGAGLGGGSSDAAAVLKTLAKVQPTPPSEKDLLRCARPLGADVPFFLKGGLALGKGIGDELLQLEPHSRLTLIVVYPGFGVSTKEAYSQVRVPVDRPRKVKTFLKAFQYDKINDWAPLLFNRFEEFVFPQFPAIARLKAELITAGCAGALMSGSGSTVFGVARSPSEGRRILQTMKKKYKQSWLVQTV